MLHCGVEWNICLSFHMIDKQNSRVNSQAKLYKIFTAIAIGTQIDITMAFQNFSS